MTGTWQQGWRSGLVPQSIIFEMFDMWQGNYRNKSVTWGYQIYESDEPFYVDCWDADDPERATWGKVENFETYDDALDYLLFLLQMSREEYFKREWRAGLKPLSQALTMYGNNLNTALKQEDEL